MERNYKMDNMRCVLMFLVVFGHLLEFVKGTGANNIYRVIYSFHMPAFLFITGYFASFKPKKILKGLVVPYLLFQPIYLAFNYFVIHNAGSFVLQYTTPHWILWYLVAAIGYYLLIPFISVQSNSKKIAVVVISLAVSLVSGYDKTIGFYFSFARILTFLPFFVAGFYAKDFIIKNNLKTAVVSGALVLVMVVLLCYSHISRTMLHGAYFYEKLNYGPGVRLFLIISAACWIMFLLHSITDKKLPLISVIGQNTLPVFLLHGFITRFLGCANIFKYSQISNILLATGISVAILIAFGNPYVKRVFKLL